MRRKALESLMRRREEEQREERRREEAEGRRREEEQAGRGKILIPLNDESSSDSQDSNSDSDVSWLVGPLIC